MMLLFIVACPSGYHGDNCTSMCPTNTYGDSCGHKCTCSPCHHIYGCSLTTIDTGGEKVFNDTLYFQNKYVS